MSIVTFGGFVALALTLLTAGYAFVWAVFPGEAGKEARPFAALAAILAFIFGTVAVNLLHTGAGMV